MPLRVGGERTGTTNTILVIHNFLPSSCHQPQRKNSNGGAFDVNANIKKVSFIRGGQLFPLDSALGTVISCKGMKRTQ